MKKSLIALAALAVAGVASAQSSVTLFGVVDVALQHGTGSITDQTQVGSGGYATSRLGFRGTEDLGGGLAASFWLEAGYNADNGTGHATSIDNKSLTLTNGGLMFNRRSTVSLSGGWGEVRLGRDIVPQFWNVAVFDPFGIVGTGVTLLATGSRTGPGVLKPENRASNSIGYFLPAKIGGFYGQAQVSLGENPKTGVPADKNGNGYGLRVGYAAGPFNVAVAHGVTKGSVLGDLRSTNLGGQWDLGMARVMAAVSRDRNNSATGKGALIGALFPIGAGEIRTSLSQYTTDQVVGNDPRVRKLALGYVHNLSKRTALYTTVARLKNSGSADMGLNGAKTAANTSSTGFDLGVRHNF